MINGTATSSTTIPWGNGHTDTTCGYDNNVFYFHPVETDHARRLREFREAVFRAACWDESWQLSLGAPRMPVKAPARCRVPRTRRGPLEHVLARCVRRRGPIRWCRGIRRKSSSRRQIPNRPSVLGA